MATQDISQLVVEVKSTGIQTAANQLDKLTAASEKAEAAVKKLGSAVIISQSGTATSQAQAAASSVSSATATAKQLVTISQKRDIEMYNSRVATEARLKAIGEKRDTETWQSAVAQSERLSMLQQKRDVEEWTAAQEQAAKIKTIQEKRDIEIYEEAVSSASRVRAIQEKRDIEEWESAQSQAAKIKAIQEKRDVELYEERVAQTSKFKGLQEKRDMEEWTSAQTEAARMKALEEKRDIELYEMRVAANARLRAEEEKQRSLNVAFQTSSVASQITAATRAQAYSAAGGDATARFGSAAATADIVALRAAQDNLARATTAAAAAQQAENVAMAEAHALARGLSGSLGALWVTYGNLAGMAAGLAIGASLKEIVSVGVEVESTLEGIRVKTGQSMEDMALLGDTVLKVGAGVYGPKEVAKALEDLALAGLNAKQSMDALSPAMNLAIAGGTSLEKAAETLVTVGTAVGANSKEYTYLADGITTAANASLASVDSVANAMRRASSVNKLYGASFDDILLQISALSSLGIKDTAAGTAILNMMADMQGRTKKAKTALDELGMSFSTATGKAKPTYEAFKEFDKLLSKYSTDQQKGFITDIFGKQALRDVAELRGLLHEAADDSGSFANKFEELKAKIENSAGSSSIAAVQMAMTSQNQIKSVWNTLQTSMAKAFGSTGGMLDVFLLKMKEAFASPEFITGMSNLANGAASLAVFLADMIGPIGAIVEGFVAFKTITMSMAAATAFQAWLVAQVTAYNAITLSAEAATVATTAFKASTSFIPGLGIALGIVTAALILFNFHSSKTKDHAIETAEAYRTNYLTALKDEADKMQRTVELLAKKTPLQEAETQAIKDQAKAQADLNNQKAISAAQAAVATAQANVDRALSSTSPATALLSAKYLSDLESAKKTLGDTQASVAKFNTESSAAIQTIIEGSKKKKEAYLAEQAAAEAAAQAAAGNGKRNGKEDKAAAADGYAEAIKVFQDNIKAAHQELSNFEELQQSKFRSGEIGKLQLINGNADKEIAIYKRVADESLKAKNVADHTKNKTADSERFGSDAGRAGTDAAQSEKMRAQSKLEAEKEMQSQVTRLKVKALEEQGKYVAAANLKWGQDGKVALDQARADVVAYGSEASKEYLAAQQNIHGAAMEAAQLKEDSLAFDTALLNVQGTLKGFKAATYGTSIDTMFDSAVASTKKYEQALQEAKNKQMTLALAAGGITGSDGSPEAQKKLAEANKELAAMADKQKTMWEGVGQSISDSLGKAFGTSGTALGELFKATIKFDQTQSASASDRIGQYGDMAQAASGFFDKQSKGYRALNTISQVFHIAQMARTIAQTAASVIAGAANFFAQSGWGGFAGVAAMGAVLAGLGYSMSGSSSKADPKLDAEYVQKQQGTGTVFGDAEAKSESISKAMDILKSNSDMMLPINQGMLLSLKNIEASMAGIANLAIRGGITDSSNMGISTNSSKSSMSWATAIATSGFMAPITKLLGNLWGKSSTEISDSGLQFGGKVSDLQAGQGIDQYAAIKNSSSSWFGLKKSSNTSIQTQGVSDDMSKQFGLIFTNLEAVMKGAATTLGTTGDAVGKAIEGMVLSTTKVSLKDLKGDDLTNAINNVISGAMDEVAKQAYPQMQAFQQVGEGYAQTVIRVASGVEQANVALKKLGVTAIDYTAIANKTSDVSYELVKQSIALKEGTSGVGQIISQVTGATSDVVSAYTDLVSARKKMEQYGLGKDLNFDTLSGAGDLKSLGSDLSTYYDKFFSDQEKATIMTKDMTTQFTAFGYSLPKSRDELRNWIEAAAKTGSQLKVGELLSLASGFDTLQSALEKLGLAVDTNPFSDNAVKDAKQAYDDAVDTASNAYDILETSINKQKEAIQTTVDNIKGILGNLADALKATAPAQDAATAFKKAMSVVSHAISTVNGGGDISKVSGLDDAITNASNKDDSSYSDSFEYRRAQALANSALTELNNAGQKQLSDGEKMLDKLQSQLDVAKAQLDTLKGIDTSVMSVADALANFSTAIAAGNSAKGIYDATVAGNKGTTADAVESLYKSVLGRPSDAGGKAYWTDAIDNKGVSVAQASAFMTNSSENQSGQLDKLYQSVFGRAADAGGKEYYLNAMKNGASLADITKQLYNSDEYKSLPSFDVGTNNVPEDMVAMIHKGERIIPAADNADLQRKLDGEDSKESSSAEVTELRAQFQELSNSIKIGDVANVKITKELVKVVTRWETDGMPPTRSTE